MIVDIHTADKEGNFITLMAPETVIFEGNILTVPAGFSYDGASVPRFFWRLVFPPVHHKSRRAGLFHDWLYRTQPAGWTRKDADRLFYCLLVADGTPRFRAGLAYTGLRAFGWIAWQKNRRG